MDRDRPKFPHLENLNRAPQVLEAESVRVSEKIDGFNARFGKGLDGQLWAGTRNREIDLATEPTQGFAEFVLGLNPLMIQPGETWFGEWAGKGIQKRIDYGQPGFWLFAIRKMDDEWANDAELTMAAFSLSLRLAPVLYEGLPPSLEELDALRDAPGVAGLSEGIVIWPHPMVLDRYGNPLIAKYKAPAFEERASQRVSPPVRIVETASAKAFVAEYATEERFAHVLQQVGQGDSQGQPVFFDPLAPELTGDVLRAMYQDVVREGAADYAALDEDAQKLVGKVLNPITKGLLDDARAAVLREAIA